MSRSLIPNSTQVPDVILDEWLPNLTGAEFKVVMYIVRRTYGFGKKDGDTISIGQIATGIVSKKGERLDSGTGLNRDTICKALASLEEKGVIRSRHRESKVRGHLPNFYSLNLNAELKGPTEALPLSENPTTPYRKKRLGVVGKNDYPLIGKSDSQETADSQETVLQETAATIGAPVQMKSSPTISSAAAVSSNNNFHQDSFDLLKEQGFDEDAARRLAVHPIDHIRKQIQLLAQRKPSQNPLGLLRRSIEGNYSVPGNAVKSAQTAKPLVPTKDPAVGAREALQRDVARYAAYREGKREKIKESHSEAYTAYEQKSAEMRAEVARKSPNSIELTMFDKRGMEEPRFVEFFREYEPCPVLSFDEWVQAGKPKVEE